MATVTLTGSAYAIEDVYLRLRRIDSIRDGIIDGAITRDELDTARKQGVDTTMQFDGCRASDLDTIQKLYLKLQAWDKEDGALDGKIKMPDLMCFYRCDIDVQSNSLVYISGEDREKRNAVLHAVMINGLALKDVEGIFKRDRVIVLAAIKENAGAAYYADGSLLKDKEFLLTAIKESDLVLQHVSPSIKRDKEFMLTAVKQNKAAFIYVDESLKNDKDVLAAAGK